MPFRCLEYVTALYSAMFKNEEKYKKKKLLFPRPEFYVFYNGKKKYPAQEEMKLSDSYFSENPKNLPLSNLLDLTVKVINLNAEENMPFLKKCLPLESYTKFVQYVIIYKEKGEKDYVAKAFDRCINENLLPDYFSEIEKEEQTMIFGEYSYEDDVRVQRAEEAEITREENARNLLKENISPEIIARCCSLPLEKVQKLESELEATLAKRP